MEPIEMKKTIERNADNQIYETEKNTFRSKKKKYKVSKNIAKGVITYENMFISEVKKKT